MDKIAIQLRHFDGLLQDGIEQTTLLIELLKEEYRSLQHMDPTNLETITQQKKELLHNLQSIAKSQDTLLQNMGYSTDPEGMENYINNLDDESQLKCKWDNLQDLLAKCKKQNEINKGVITISRRQATNALDLLYGLSAGTKTYGPTGESQSDRQSNSLGKA
ncbi:MAG: flagellar protein FlgN [Chromatiales bacterium]|jgi:flagellar biosynthesis/type III secretory pathway chaperone